MKQQLKQTIAQRMNFLESQTKYTVNYMAGGQYFFRTGTRHANIAKLNGIFAEVGLAIKGVNINDSQTLTFELGEI